jgi:hypothetical protein
MIIEGIIFCFISIVSFIVNLVACWGISTKIKKIVVVEWIFSIILMLSAEAFAIYVYLQSAKAENFIDNVALKVLQTFIGVNLLDLLFWLWGYLTLEYENGDKIRDELMRQNHDSENS